MQSTNNLNSFSQLFLIKIRSFLQSQRNDQGTENIGGLWNHVKAFHLPHLITSWRRQDGGNASRASHVHDLVYQQLYEYHYEEFPDPHEL